MIEAGKAEAAKRVKKPTFQFDVHIRKNPRWDVQAERQLVTTATSPQDAVGHATIRLLNIEKSITLDGDTYTYDQQGKRRILISKLQEDSKTKGELIEVGAPEEIMNLFYTEVDQPQPRESSYRWGDDRSDVPEIADRDKIDKTFVDRKVDLGMSMMADYDDRVDSVMDYLISSDSNGSESDWEVIEEELQEYKDSLKASAVRRGEAKSDETPDRRKETPTEDVQEKLKELEDKAYKDQLTGLYNRTYMVDNEDSLLKDYKSVMIFDIDHFKKINDSIGHVKADEVLKVVTKIIQESQGTVPVIRWGGEEVISFSSKESQEAFEDADKIRAAIQESTKAQSEKLGVPEVTVSAGVAPLVEDIDSSLEKADCGLYQSKETGRNKSTLFTDKMNCPLHEESSEGEIVKASTGCKMSSEEALDKLSTTTYNDLKTYCSMRRAGIRDTLKVVFDLIAPFSFLFTKNAKLKTALQLIKEYLSEGITLTSSVPVANTRALEYRFAQLIQGQGTPIEDLELYEVLPLCYQLKQDVQEEKI